MNATKIELPPSFGEPLTQSETDLVKVVVKQKAKIESLERELSVLHSKIAHGCVGMACSLCDPRCEQ